MGGTDGKEKGERRTPPWVPEAMGERQKRTSNDTGAWSSHGLTAVKEFTYAGPQAY